ncbi:MAG: hypothetical protein M9951_10090 [Burkholderiaceae bacterium]|jgi:hypothetical protein|nr:hypothetical protein [Gemmatimonadales bacterium]MCO5119967.1 hypothetical protein [Burkholderiaceae bacterium]MEB2320621.1 hypothetical protein [Pseudomonadota bacterium]
MIAVLRIVLAIGFGYAGLYALLFVFRRRRSDLRRALVGFGVTAVIALVFFIGLAIERLVSG